MSRGEDSILSFCLSSFLSFKLRLLQHSDSVVPCGVASVSTARCEGIGMLLWDVAEWWSLNSPHSPPDLHNNFCLVALVVLRGEDPLGSVQNVAGGRSGLLCPACASLKTSVDYFPDAIQFPPILFWFIWILMAHTFPSVFRLRHDTLISSP